MVYSVVLDLKDKAPAASNITLTQSDYNAYTLHLFIRQDGLTVDLTDYTQPRIALAKPDGTIVQGELAQHGNHYVYEIGTNDIAAVGMITASVVLYGEEKRVSTQPFLIRVMADPLPVDAIRSSTEFDALQGLIDNIHDMIEDGDLNGPRGETGPQGLPGATPDISIGMVTTLPAGSEATVELDPSSTPTEPVINFGIPKGQDGTGAGDMTVAEYGGSAPGVVAAADTTPWAGVSGKPSTYPSEWGDVADKPTTYPPTTHNHDTLYYGKAEVDALIEGVEQDIPATLDDLTDGATRKLRYPVLTTGTQLAPNTQYNFGQVTSLSLTLGTPISGAATEYLFTFRCGASAATLALPSTVKWLGGEPMTIAANKSYAVSILYDGNGYLAVGGEFA